MKKLSIICLLLVTFFLLPNLLFAKRNQNIKGSGNLITESIPISNFSKISIGVNVEINYSQALNTGSLEFTIDDNLLEYYDIYTENDVLYIKRKNRFSRNSTCLNPTKKLITVSSDQLEDIIITGGSKVNFCTGFTSNKLNLNLTGSSRVFLNQHPVNIENCRVSICGSANAQFMGEIQSARIDISGSGSVQFEGSIQQAKICVSGSGRVKALECKIMQLKADLSGSGAIEAQVLEKLDASVCGSGRIRFKGMPDITNFNVTGSEKITKI